MLLKATIYKLSTLLLIIIFSVALNLSSAKAGVSTKQKHTYIKKTEKHSPKSANNLEFTENEEEDNSEENIHSAVAHLNTSYIIDVLTSDVIIEITDNTENNFYAPVELYILFHSFKAP